MIDIKSCLRGFGYRQRDRRTGIKLSISFFLTLNVSIFYSLLLEILFFFLVFTNNIKNIYALYSDIECCGENILSQNKTNLSPLFRPTTRAREVGPNENTNDDHIKGHDYLVSMEMKG